MRFIMSLALVALLNNARADDLFTDDGEAADTLQSIKAAEKIHKKQFKGISKEDEKMLVTEKSKMNFDNQGMFLANEKRYYGLADKNLLQTRDDMFSRTAQQDGQVLAGTLNDEEEENGGN